jgi:hypothetical protein
MVQKKRGRPPINNACDVAGDPSKNVAAETKQVKGAQADHERAIPVKRPAGQLRTLLVKGKNEKGPGLTKEERCDLSG